jgi:hypothetical protein
VFIRALLIIVKLWKQSRCPSAGEWINCSTSCNVVFFSSENKWTTTP